MVGDVGKRVGTLLLNQSSEFVLGLRLGYFISLVTPISFILMGVWE